MSDAQIEFAHRYVTELSRAALRSVESQARTTVVRIRREVPAYQVVDASEHQAHVHQQLRSLLGGLADARRPTSSELDDARALGARRAMQGMRLEAVMTAYHLGYHHLWTSLLERARAEGPQESLALLAVVESIWTWVEIMSAAAADGYASAMNAEQAQRIDAGHRLVASLYAGEAALESTAFLARSIGFDPGASFCVISMPITHGPGDLRADLEHAARAARRPAHVETRQEAAVLIAQTTHPHELLRDSDALPHGRGISAVRSGLVGLAQCLRDADSAMALATQTGAEEVDFPTQWWAVTLNEKREAIAPFVTSATARDAAHLAEAVRAYADNGFSITAAGAALHVHPNTVKYRLDRWQTLTGWDPRTFDGLLHSLTNLTLAPWG